MSAESRTVLQHTSVNSIIKYDLQLKCMLACCGTPLTESFDSASSNNFLSELLVHSHSIFFSDNIVYKRVAP